MKNLLKSSLIAAVMFTASATFANEGIYSLTVNNNKVIRFVVEKEADVQLTIRDYNSQLVFDEKMHTTNVAAKSYDLSALPDGEYLLSIVSDNKLAEYKVIIENNKAVLSAPIIKSILKPVFKQDQSVVLLELDNPDRESVEVKILNEDGEELYKNTYTNKSKLVKRFNLGKIYANELTFVVKSKNQEVLKTISNR
jgi:hypothetical protein